MKLRSESFDVAQDERREIRIDLESFIDVTVPEA